MRILADPRPDKPVHCEKCGWDGFIAQTKCALWLDMENTTPINLGGDGKNYRCPICHTKVDQVRYPKINVPGK